MHDRSLDSGESPPQDDLYQRSVSLVLGLQEFGLLMVGRRLVEAPWDAEGVPLSGYAIMSRVGPLAFIICFVLLEISGCFEFSVVKWLALLVSWKLEFWRGAYHDACHLEDIFTGRNTFGTCFGETGLKIRPDVFRHDNCEQKKHFLLCKMSPASHFFLFEKGEKNYVCNTRTLTRKLHPFSMAGLKMNTNPSFHAKI